MAEATAIVKGLGMRLEYDPELGEYAVFTPYAARDIYYTQDREDAVDTARVMAAKKEKRK